MKRWLRILETDAARFDDQLLAADAMLAKGRMLRAQRDYRDAQAPLDKALDLRRGALGDSHIGVSEVHVAYADLRIDQQRYDEAVKHGRKAVGICQTLGGDHSLPLAQARAGLGRALLAKGQPQAALRELKLAERDQLLGVPINKRDGVNVARDGIATAHAALGQWPEAKKALNSSTLSRKQTWRLAISLSLEGELMARAGEQAEGLKRLLESVAHLEKHFGKNDPRLTVALRALGRGQSTAGALGSARKTLSRTLKIVLSQVGYEPLWALVHEELAEVERLAGRSVQRLKHLDDAHVLISSAYGQQHTRNIYNILERSDVAYALGQKSYSERLYRGVLRRLTKLHGPSHPDTKRAADRAAPASAPAPSAPAEPPRPSVKAELHKRTQELLKETAEKL